MIEKAKFTVDRHADLTANANPGLLDDEEVGRVVLANMMQDLDQVYSPIHFDNCTFPEGVDRINSFWLLIEKEGQINPTTLGAFGMLLHTVQDFYAHSNWVELNADRSPVPVWNLEIASLPREIVTGTWFLGHPKKCHSGAPSHDQLNKDSPKSKEGRKAIESGPNAGQTLFALAYDAALWATRIQYERLAVTTGRAIHSAQPSQSNRGVPFAVDASMVVEMVQAMHHLRDESPT